MLASLAASPGLTSSGESAAAAGECKAEAAAEVEQPSECLICRNGEEDEVALHAHGCSTCKRDAWVICDECDERCVSRMCPVCRCDYAPLKMYRFPLLRAARPADMRDGTARGTDATRQDSLASQPRDVLRIAPFSIDRET